MSVVSITAALVYNKHGLVCKQQIKVKKKKHTHTQAVHTLLHLSTDIAGNFTLNYKNLMYKHKALDLSTLYSKYSAWFTQADLLIPVHVLADNPGFHYYIPAWIW